MQPISYMYRKYANRSHISCEHEKKTRYARKQSRKSCSDRTPENKISALRAYKENDTFYAWKNGQNLISISRRTYPRRGVSTRDSFGKRTCASLIRMRS